MKLPKLQSFIVFSNTHLKFLALVTLLLLLGASYFHSGGGTTLTLTPVVPGRNINKAIVASKRPGDPPVLAYWIYGSSGDGQRILRVLKAVYHPRNQYLLLLDASSSLDERTDLALSVQSHPVFSVFDNVDVIGRSYAVNQMGGSGLAALLHASALLLKLSTTWDWFIPLSASDYPLFTQDDILHAFTSLPRDLNFVHFANTSTSDEDGRVKQVVVDPSIYERKSSPIFYGKEGRNAPNTFKILAGSPWVILSRSLIEFCVEGWDNFPRKLLMYMSNLVSPLEFYFQTVICNTPAFHNTTVDNDLRYHVMSRNESLSEMGETAIAATALDDALLQEIDNNVLNQSANGVVPGKWCLAPKANATGNGETKDKQIWGDVNSVEASPQGVKLGLTLSRLANQRVDVCANLNRS
ncbi:beta-glucuronosyltransferase GlcAT14B-like [Bidens hawaiensis]|uniref:beta-glucuronosyltransferase GlcAT14B-like n=1 Tax=Bidens hawaiensis TaxID=980011 RepID=UPI00404B3E69